MKGNRIYLYLLLVMLALHFLLTGFFSFTSYPRSGPLAAISEWYTVPAFYQNWSLFAPDVPAYDAQLEYRSAHDGRWSEWKDAGNGTHPLETIEQSYVVGLSYQVVQNLYRSMDRTQFDRIVESRQYHQALTFVNRLLEETSPDSVQLKLKFRFTPAPDKAYTFQRTELEFPVSSKNINSANTDIDYRELKEVGLLEERTN